MATVTCPNPDCGMPGTAGAFCEYCGTELPTSEAENRQQPQAEAPAAEPSGFGELPTLPKVPSLPDLPPLPDIPPLKTQFDPEFSQSGFGFADDGSKKPQKLTIAPGEQFAVVCTAPELMWKGENSTVKFRFKAERDYFCDVTLVLRNCEEELARQSLGRRPYDAEHEFVFNVIPKTAGGCVSLSVDILCERDGYESGDAEKYTARIDVAVRDEKKPASINIGGINIGEGSTIYKGFNFTSFDDAFGNRSKSAYKLVERVLEPKIVMSPRRLTLVDNPENAVGKKLQLIAISEGECLTFGRHSGTTVPIRVFDSATKELDKDKSKRISCVHFRLQPDKGGKLRIFDGSEEKPSSNGLTSGGTWIASDGRCTFGAGIHDLVLGGEKEKLIGLGIEVCGDRYSISGFKMTRDDGADQTVFGVLKKISCGNGQESILWDGCSFALEDSSGKREILRPGMSVSVGGVAYEVCVHRKCYI